MARRGVARTGGDWRGLAGQAWQGEAWRGEARHGKARKEIFKGGTPLVFEWKMKGLYPVAAQAAGMELERIYKDYGRCDAADVVDESRPEEAVLHPCFEWRDHVAAEFYRQQQARNLVGCIVTVEEPQKNERVEVRAFAHVSGTYTPMTVVVRDQDKRAELVEKTLREFRAIRDKANIISDEPRLMGIFQAIDAATA